MNSSMVSSMRWKKTSVGPNSFSLSAHSRSDSGLPTEVIVQRTASAPYSATSSSGFTPVPFDLDIFSKVTSSSSPLPLLCSLDASSAEMYRPLSRYVRPLTMACISSVRKGSRKPMKPFE